MPAVINKVFWQPAAVTSPEHEGARSLCVGKNHRKKKKKNPVTEISLLSDPIFNPWQKMVVWHWYGLKNKNKGFVFDFDTYSYYILTL